MPPSGTKNKSSSRKDSPPSIWHFCAQSRAGSLLRGVPAPASNPRARSPQQVLPGDTEGDGGLQESSNSDSVAHAALTAARGRGGSVRGFGQLRLGDTRLGLRPSPRLCSVPSAERRPDRVSGWVWLGPVVLKCVPPDGGTWALSALPRPGLNPPDQRARARRPWQPKRQAKGTNSG